MGEYSANSHVSATRGSGGCKESFCEESPGNSQTYLARRVSAGLTKLSPFLLANVVLVAYNVIDAFLVGCKCSFRREIRLILSPPLPHSLKYFFNPQIRCFGDLKLSLTNEKLHFFVTKLQFDC